MGFRFRMTEYPGDNRSYEDAGDWYEFGPGGVLGVHFGQPGRWSEYYPPGAWTELTADQPPGQQTANSLWGFYT